jgi:hypothetical protein
MELDLDVSFESANSARFADMHHSKPKGWCTNRERANRRNSRNSQLWSWWRRLSGLVASHCHEIFKFFEKLIVV